MGKSAAGGQARAVRGNSVSESLLFAWNFLKHPHRVGWVVPSSRFLVNEVLDQVDWARARVIVEYGPGVGSFTRGILRRMRPDARLVAFEINRQFAGKLGRTIRDPRFRLLSESAEEVGVHLPRLGFTEADCIISGIPFKTIPDGVRERIVRQTHAVLKPGGQFLVYQFSGVVLPYLEAAFGNVYRGFEWLNILPARLFYCARPTGGRPSLGAR